MALRRQVGKDQAKGLRAKMVMEKSTEDKRAEKTLQKRRERQRHRDNDEVFVGRWIKKKLRPIVDEFIDVIRRAE